MNHINAYSANQFRALELDTSAYHYNQLEGTYAGRLDLKKWGKHQNMLIFCTMDDGRKLICSAPQMPHNYLGLKDIPMGARVALTFGKSRSGKLRLDAVQEFSSKEDD
ncbi:MAG: hypothetical protein RR828_04195, partial [Oscillospiraceae bacterium]